jgi:hypothetical protein
LNHLCHSKTLDFFIAHSVRYYFVILLTPAVSAPKYVVI